jgi:hypothetical protein
MRIVQDETREYLHAMDKRQQDMSAALQVVLDTGGGPRTEVVPHTSRPRGKRKPKKQKAKLEKIRQAMNDPQWSYFKVSHFHFLVLFVTFFFVGVHTKTFETASERRPSR